MALFKKVRRPGKPSIYVSGSTEKTTDVQAMLQVGTQEFVDQTKLIDVPHTTIIGRAKIPDLKNDLRASMGIERIMTQQIMQLQDEFGLNGEPVFAALNDDRGLIRFVGGWYSYNGIYGMGSGASASGTDYLEITFYGTGINLLTPMTSSSIGVSYSLDGGTLTALSIPANLSPMLASPARNYCINQLLPIISTTVGLHTIKIVSTTSTAVSLFGYEILNSNASGLININPGVGYVNGQKIIKPIAAAVPYNTGVTGTRGGRIVRYVGLNGNIGEAFTPVDAAAAYLASADHSNEEVVRTYNWREFGAGRADDFSLLDGTTRAAAFTLDDGTTTLAGNSIISGNTTYYADNLRILSDQLTLTFMGTGLDADMISFGGVGNTVSIDGGSDNAIVAQTKTSVVKIVSGLPYGTHTAKFTRGSGGVTMDFKSFIVYQPKKPAIPTTAIEVCDYNVMADFISCVAGDVTVSTGVLRKAVAREMVYVGSGWVFFGQNSFGQTTTTSTNNDSLQYTFFGTGFSYRFQNASATSVTAQMTLTNAANPSGTTNFSGFTVATNGTGISSFVAATATLTTTTTNTVGNVLSVSGMPLGWHTIKITKLSGAANFFQEALDIITPIHSHKSNLYADLQNTLPIGSQSLMDTRKTSMIKEILPAQKAWAQAIGTASASTGSTSFVPCPDMSLTLRAKGAIEISYGILVHYTSSVGNAFFKIYVNGAPISSLYKAVTPHATNVYHFVTDSLIVPISDGVHKIDVYWYTSVGTLNANGVHRNLTVKER